MFANEKKGECRGDSEIQKEVLVVTGEGMILAHWNMKFEARSLNILTCAYALVLCAHVYVRRPRKL